MLPRTVVYDPELTVLLPADTTAASGMNALAHALEAGYAPDATTAAGRAGRGRPCEPWRRGCPLPSPRVATSTARTEALYGAWLAGWASAAPRWGCTTSSPTSWAARYRLPHAGVHSALLPQVAAFNAPAAPQAFARAAHALGVDGRRPRRGPGALRPRRRGSAPRRRWPALGLRADAVDDVAAAVAAAEVPNPRAFDVADLRRLLGDALAGRRPSTDAAQTSSHPGGA